MNLVLTKTLNATIVPNENVPNELPQLQHQKNSPANSQDQKCIEQCCIYKMCCLQRFACVNMSTPLLDQSIRTGMKGISGTFLCIVACLFLNCSTKLMLFNITTLRWLSVLLHSWADRHPVENGH